MLKEPIASALKAKLNASSRRSKTHVDLHVAAAALAHLTAVEGVFHEDSHYGAGRGLEDTMLKLERLIAPRIRERLLSDNTREPFSRGLFDVGHGTVAP